MREAIDGTPGLTFSQPTDANAVFAVLDNAVADRVRDRFRFYDWDRAAGQVRWMCSFDTTEDDVDVFVSVVLEELARLTLTAVETPSPRL